MRRERFCLNCRFCEEIEMQHCEVYEVGYRCNHPDLVCMDPVTGDFTFGECYELRKSSGGCGPDGSRWVRKAKG